MMERVDRCPICKQRNIVQTQSYHEKNKVRDDMECSDCKATWQNVYAFSRHYKVTEGEPWTS
jgi:hypothetical protein